MTVASGVVRRHLDEIEQRLDALEQRMHALEGFHSDLKYEVAELQEA
jgi:chaperonin cofactor prefoldin